MTNTALAPPAPSRAADGHAGGTAVTRELLATLRAWGVRRIYCCPGSTEAALLDALVTTDAIELVLVTHESVAVAMAEGDARTTGRPAVAYLHTHVGLGNALAHLSSARPAHAPVVVLTGLKSSVITGREAFTSIDQPADLVRQYVKWAHTCAASGQVVDDIDRALHIAVTEPAGPVWLGLPQDLLESDAVGPPRSASRKVSTAAVRASAAAVQAAGRLLAEAHRPVFVTGGDLARRGAVAAALELARRLGAPVFDEGRRDFLASCVPADAPGRCGLYDPRHPALRAADVVVFLGCRLFTEFEPAPAGADLPPSARLIHQHSDPAEIGRLNPVDVALAGDPAEILAELVELVPDADRPAAQAEPGVADAAPAQNHPGHRRLESILAPLTEAVLASDATVVLDATTATVPLLRAIKPTRPAQLLSSTSGSLGWGMGAALGVRLADPTKPVLAVVGDGAFQFGLPALWTAHRYNIPVTFAVLDNRAYAAVASALGRFGGAAVQHNVWPGTDIAGPQIAAIAAGFGLDASTITSANELGDALVAALRADRPAVLDVITA